MCRAVDRAAGVAPRDAGRGSRAGGGLCAIGAGTRHAVVRGGSHRAGRGGGGDRRAVLCRHRAGVSGPASAAGVCRGHQRLGYRHRDRSVGGRAFRRCRCLADDVLVLCGAGAAVRAAGTADNPGRCAARGCSRSAARGCSRPAGRAAAVADGGGSGLCRGRRACRCHDSDGAGRRRCAVARVGGAARCGAAGRRVVAQSNAAPRLGRGGGVSFLFHRDRRRDRVCGLCAGDLAVHRRAQRFGSRLCRRHRGAGLDGLCAAGVGRRATGGTAIGARRGGGDCAGHGAVDGGDGVGVGAGGGGRRRLAGGRLWAVVRLCQPVFDDQP